MMYTANAVNKKVLLCVEMLVVLVLFVVAYVFNHRSHAVLHTVNYQGRVRDYYVYIPNDIKKFSKKLPLVIVLHGAGSHGLNVEKSTKFSETAQKEGFVVVYPNGFKVSNGMHAGWNAVHCCGDAMELNIDDVGFIGFLIDEMVKNAHVDAARVYVLGNSNGGMLAQRVAREIPHKITAVASVVAGAYGDEVAGWKSVPIMFINDQDDAVIPFNGGILKADSQYKVDRVVPFKSSLYQSQFWAKVNGCAPNPRISVVANVKVLQYICPHGNEVVHYVTHGLGHVWPEMEAPFNATDIVWDFFVRHVKK